MLSISADTYTFWMLGFCLVIPISFIGGVVFAYKMMATSFLEPAEVLFVLKEDEDA